MSFGGVVPRACCVVESSQRLFTGSEYTDKNERLSLRPIQYMSIEPRCCGGVQHHDGEKPLRQVP